MSRSYLSYLISRPRWRWKRERLAVKPLNIVKFHDPVIVLCPPPLSLPLVKHLATIHRKQTEVPFTTLYPDVVILTTCNSIWILERSNATVYYKTVKLNSSFCPTNPFFFSPYVWCWVDWWNNNSFMLEDNQAFLPCCVWVVRVTTAWNPQLIPICCYYYDILLTKLPFQINC